MSIEAIIARAKERQALRLMAAEGTTNRVGQEPKNLGQQESNKKNLEPGYKEILSKLFSSMGLNQSPEHPKHPEHPEPQKSESESALHLGAFSYNQKQKEFISLGSQRNSCVLIGAAGTGKTTAQTGFVQALIDSGSCGTIQTDDHKYLIKGTPGIVVCAFTRRAVRNIRKRMPAALQSNCMTIHKLLEYKREFEQVIDPQTGDFKTIKVFRPARNSFNPLSYDISCVIFEEASMIGVPLFDQYKDALTHQVQEIFLGDLNQIPPVMGRAILGYKLNELPVVELDQVYRQALESPIISFAHKILAGNPLKKDEIKSLTRQGFSSQFWGKKTYPENAVDQVGSHLCKLYDSGAYDPEEDVILTPQNVGFGTIELNKHLADHMARKRGAITYEIIAGFVKLYLSVGDRILYEKEEAVIEKISPNLSYHGVRPQSESSTLSYWGHKSEPESKSDEELSEDELFESMANFHVQEDRVNKSSHIVTLRLLESDEEVTLDSAAELNAIEFSYCMTVHKAQGSEWRKVWFITHHSQARMWSRELLYTAVTRAKEELHLLVEPETFVKGIMNQRIKGKNWQEKAMSFMEAEKEN